MSQQDSERHEIEGKDVEKAEKAPEHVMADAKDYFSTMDVDARVMDLIMKHTTIEDTTTGQCYDGYGNPLSREESKAHARNWESATPRSTDPCPCGSGRKYKRCCFRRRLKTKQK